MRTVDQRRAASKPSARGAGPLLAATAVSVTGDGAFIAAAPLLASAITSDPVAVSTVTAAVYAPWLLAGLPAGALVDRWPRRAVMVTADLVRALLLAGLCALVLTGYATIVGLVVTVFLVGVAQCFFDSATQAAIPAMLGRDREALARVNGRYWALDTAGRSLLGPLGGSAAFGYRHFLPFLADAVSFLVSAAFISRLPWMPAPSGPHESVATAVRAGLRHLFRTGELRVLAVSMGAYNFAYNLAIATFVLYAKNVLEVIDVGYGALLAAMAIGGVAAGWKAAPLIRNRSARQVMAVASLVQGLAWMGAALAGNAWIVGGCFIFLGAGSAVSTVAVASARQILTPDGLIGRVVSAFRLFGVGAAALGALVGGVIADTFGLHTPLWTAGALLMVTAACVWPRKPAARTQV